MYNKKSEKYEFIKVSTTWGPNKQKYFGDLTFFTHVKSAEFSYETYLKCQQSPKTTRMNFLAELRWILIEAWNSSITTVTNAW